MAALRAAVFFSLLIAIPARQLDAACSESYILSGGPAAYDWATAPWVAASGAKTLPGSGSADCVTIASGFSISLTVAIANPLTSCDVSAGGQLTIAAGGRLLLTNPQTILGTIVVDGGELSNAGIVTLAPGARLTMSGGLLTGAAIAEQSGATIDLTGTRGPMAISEPLGVAGAVNLTSVANPVVLAADVSITTGGVFELNGDAPIQVKTGMPANPSILNAGSFQKVNAGASTVDAVFVNDGGTLEIRGTPGTLSLGDGGRGGGTFSSAAGSAIELRKGVFHFAGATFGATTTISVLGKATFSADSDLTVPNLVSASAGASIVVLPGNVLTVSKSATLNDATIKGGELRLFGTATITGNTSLFDDHASIHSYDHTLHSGVIEGYGGAAVINEPGGVWTADGAAMFRGAGPFTNRGTIIQQGPEFFLDNLHNEGRVEVCSGSTLKIHGTAVIERGSEIESSGTVMLTTYYLICGYQFHSLNGPSLTNNGLVTTSRFSMDAGTLDGSGDLVITEEGYWLGGTIKGAGEIITRSGAVLYVAYPFNPPVPCDPCRHFLPMCSPDPWPSIILDGTTLVNRGNISLSVADGNGMTLKNGASIVNESGGIAVVSGIVESDGTTTIQNAGQFTMYYCAIRPRFTNTGAVKIVSLSSSYAVVDAYTQTTGSTIFGVPERGPGFMQSPVLNILGGTLEGNGTIVGSVVNGGTLAPGMKDAPGTLTVTGDYTQTGGEAAFRVGGTFDRLNVGGAFHPTHGTLSVSRLSGFASRPGDVFDIVTHASHSGDFDLMNTAGFDAIYTPAALRLVMPSDAARATVVAQWRPTTTQPGDMVTLDVRVSGNWHIQPSGVITIAQGTAKSISPFAVLASATLVEGSASVRFALPPDHTNLVLQYSGDSQYPAVAVGLPALPIDIPLFDRKMLAALLMALALLALIALRR